MATTTILPRHIGEHRTLAKALNDEINYGINPKKTKGCELVSSYECDPKTADAEFLLSKREYFNLTGRSQGDRDVISYHFRQSFKPGEITPEEANIIGYETAIALTKGNHAFVVSTHIDKAHIHNHISFNSTTLDCTRKFRNFKGSSFVLRRISDGICLAHGLSVIENPKPSRGSYGSWLGENKKPSYQNMLRKDIDKAIEKNPKDFDDFIRIMEEFGYEVKRENRKYIAFRKKDTGQKQFKRLDTLKGRHTEQAIRDRISGSYADISVESYAQNTYQVNLLIDIQEKIKAGKGKGYEQWAKIHNLKQMSQTLLYLQEQNVVEYKKLEEKASEASSRFNEVSGRIRILEEKLKDNADLQKHIINYSKTRNTYIAYRKAGYSKKFKQEHGNDVALHQEAKKYFNELNISKLPKIAELKKDYTDILSEKKQLYKAYREAKEDMKKFQNAKYNVDRFLRTYENTEKQKQDVARD